MQKTNAARFAVAWGAFLALLLALGGSRAYADTIGPGYSLYASDGHGDTYTLVVNSVSGGTYDLTFRIDTTNYTGPSGWLDAWSLQFTGSTDLSIYSTPGGSIWSDPVNGPTGAGGCLNNPGNMWCSQATSGLALNTTTGAYMWGLTLTDPTWSGSSHVQALFGTCSNIAGTGCQGSHNLLSSDMAVPEPGTLSLLGVGMLGFLGLLRRKLFA